jgi:uncharacterized protein (TIGR03066 family)
MRTAAAAFVFLALAGFATAEDKKAGNIDAKKLVGKWEPAKPDADHPPFVLEFTDAGKFSLSYTGADGKPAKYEGTYKVNGNKVEVTMQRNGKEVTDTHVISKLTDDELVGTNPKGKEEVMKRVKAK